MTISQPNSRQEIYDRIRQTSKDEVILQEMVRLGFWPAGGAPAVDPVSEIERRKQLEAELRSLVTEQARVQNVEAVRKAMRQQRMKESRQRRAETKQRRIAQREARRAAWERRKQQEIVYLGAGVSAGLGQRTANDASLARNGVPRLADENALARAMGISLGELRFLAFSRRTSRTTHYQRFKIPKKTGGQRLISAPMPRLKRAQHWILHNVLNAVPVHHAAHGFRPGRSIVSNARPHVQADVVVNVDLRDFFPSVTYRRIKGVFRKLGYSESLATIFALLCSEPDVDAVRLDGETFYVARSERRLPQGAPTSPAVTNILCRGLDARLAGLAASLGFQFTRYADDLTFSGPAEARQHVGRLLRRLKKIVADENFEVHPDKTRVLHRGRRQEVTGLVVNDRVTVPRKMLRNFRAVLFQIERDGPAGKRWGAGDDVIAAIEGYANFVAMVQPERGRAFQQQVARIIARHGRGGGRRVQRSRWQPPGEPPVVVAEVVSQPAFTVAQPNDPPPDVLVIKDEPKKPWWKFW